MLQYENRYRKLNIQVGWFEDFVTSGMANFRRKGVREVESMAYLSSSKNRTRGFWNAVLQNVFLGFEGLYLSYLYKNIDFRVFPKEGLVSLRRFQICRYKYGVISTF